MGAAFVAPGEALVDAVTVSLVGHDEDAAVGGGRRGGKQEPQAKKHWQIVRRKVAWMTPAGERDRPTQIGPKG